jgi:hypothetical protein
MGLYEAGSCSVTGTSEAFSERHRDQRRAFIAENQAENGGFTSLFR